MTVCIAAIYKETLSNGNVDDRIVIAADWQLTDQLDRASEIGFKFHRLNAIAVALGSGDIDVFHTISSKVERRLRRQFDYAPLQEVVDTYLDEEAKYRKAYYKRNDVDPSEHRVVACLPEVLIAGFEREEARLLTIMPPSEEHPELYPPDDRTKRGWASIGSGADLADREFSEHLSVPYFGKAQTLFQCFLAKKRAEDDVFVGKKVTSLYIFTPPFDVRLVEGTVNQGFELTWNQLKEKELECKQESYERAKQIIAEAEESGALTRKRDDEK
jgi:hypothetical protein